MSTVTARRAVGTTRFKKQPPSLVTDRLRPVLTGPGPAETERRQSSGGLWTGRSLTERGNVLVAGAPSSTLSSAMLLDKEAADLFASAAPAVRKKFAFFFESSARGQPRRV
eukprot:CAMPEP_0170633148 /NCGR_PEP_ID=MMETSP0224-20130122/35774_1 /TAXON_ID=285029 /ORGANISM="Togula jolla, Strain CCCM 725" /LENGTH=110 /DNA_ID=CAMNT_0010962043 /DNA_START=52 /DNA_END=385 /DNA_ORIENTATION=-